MFALFFLLFALIFTFMCVRAFYIAFCLPMSHPLRIAAKNKLRKNMR